MAIRNGVNVLLDSIIVIEGIDLSCIVVRLEHRCMMDYLLDVHYAKEYNDRVIITSRFYTGLQLERCSLNSITRLFCAEYILLVSTLINIYRSRDVLQKRDEQKPFYCFAKRQETHHQHGNDIIFARTVAVNAETRLCF